MNAPAAMNIKASEPATDHARDAATARRDLMVLTKMPLNALVLFAAAIGYLMAVRPGAFNGWLFARTLIGTALAAMAAATLNQYLERELDGRMPRTANRPLPAGRMAPGRALALGLALAVTGLAVLNLTVNPLTGTLAAISLFIYLLLYTPLKRRSPLAMLVGAISGALPPLLGWTAAGGGLDGSAAVLFGFLYLWQIPHTLAIVWQYRAQYAAAGLPVLAVVDPTGRVTGRLAVLDAAALWAVNLVVVIQGLAGIFYGAGALIIGAVLFGAALRFARHPTPPHARVLFLATIIYLPLLLILMVLNRRG